VNRAEGKSTTRVANGTSSGEDAGVHEGREGGAGGREFGAAWRFVQRLPRAAQTGLRTNPAAVLAGVGASAFVLGALCGSRVGRVLMTTLAGYGARRFLEGPAGRELARHALDALKRAGADVNA
jgi:hypothetical protein